MHTLEIWGSSNIKNIKIFLIKKSLVNYCETEYKLAHCASCWLDGGFGVDALCSACEDGYTLTPGGEC